MWTIFAFKIVVCQFIWFFFVIITCAFLWLKERQNYFVKHKIPYLKSFPIFGALKKVALGSQGVYENIVEIYETPHLKHEKFFGFFLFHQPALMIRDMELIKKILVTDFNSFSTRFAGSDVHDPLGGYHVGFTNNTEMWKNVRTKFSPFFTGAKLKSNFEFIKSSTDKFLSDKFNNDIQKVEIDLKNTFELLFIDIIANLALGIDAKSLTNENGDLQRAFRSIFKSSLYRKCEFAAFIGMPKIMKLFGFTLFGKFTTNFMARLMPEIIQERLRLGSSRNDFIDMIIKVRKEIDVKEEVLYAQVTMFMGGAYEACVAAVIFSIYELSKQPHLQDRLREEIHSVLAPHQGKISFDLFLTQSQMPFLHQVICETLRLYTELTIIDRQCMEIDGYSLESFQIPKNMPIWLPIHAIARDEKYFPQPSKFDPNRFGNASNLPPCSFLLSFGAGQKRCIGERLALMQVKMVLVSLLKEFRFEVNANTPSEIIFKRDAFLIESEEKLSVDFVRDKMIF